jgi:CPA1 family monovalent cation:H+ antiporter
VSAEHIISILVFITAVSSIINYRYIKLPKSIGLTLITLVLSLLAAASGNLGWDVHTAANQLLAGIDFNETFLHGMLGFLLFAAALNINTVELAKHKTIVGLLATVSVVLSTIFVGFCTYALTQYLGIAIPLEYCMVFGALISPTDPITTLGILKSANAPKSLEMKIAGEALFNDGMGIVLFVVLLGVAMGSQETWTPEAASLFFVRQCIGGLVFGFAMGWLAAAILRTVDNDEVAIIVTLAVVICGHSFAHHIAHISGAITMTMSGLIVGRMLQKGKMTKETIHRLDAFWEVVDDLLNAVLFVLIGLEFLTLKFTLNTTLAAIGAIVIVIAGRWISVAIPVGCMSIFRKYSHNVVLIMTWGGLRGGISIALALAVPQGEVRDFILAITYAVVLFSITIQGLTVGKLVKTLTGRCPQPKVMQEEVVALPLIENGAVKTEYLHVP